MYLNDKKIRFNVRVSESMSAFIYDMADRYEVSPSEYIRMLVKRAMSDYKKGGGVRENGQTNFDGEF